MNSRKKKTAAAAAVVALLMILVGTFAWTDFTQHSTNVFSATENADVRLIDLFTPPESWSRYTPTVDKQVSVKNLAASGSAVYVRLQFKEYMESYSLGTEPIREDFDGDGDAEVLLFATYATGDKIGEYITASDTDAVAYLANGGDAYTYIPYEVTYPVDYYDLSLATKTVTYYRTHNEEMKNGIYGKYMIDPNNGGRTATKYYGEAEKADYPYQSHELQGASNAECLYDVHEWSPSTPGESMIANRDGIDPNDVIGKYVSWEVGKNRVDGITPAVITMEEWTNPLTYNSQPAKVWVLDTNADGDGWAYWAYPLLPDEITDDIMESVTLKKMPGQTMEYYIHIEMEAVTWDEMLSSTVDSLNQNGAWYEGGNFRGGSDGDLLVQALVAMGERFGVATPTGATNLSPATMNLKQDVFGSLMATVLDSDNLQWKRNSI